MNTLIRRALTALLLSPLIGGQASAADGAIEAVERTAREFLDHQLTGLPGKARYRVFPLDPSSRITPCPVLEAFHPRGARSMGRTSVGVRCLNEPRWTLYLTVDIEVIGQYYILARPLRAGQAVQKADLIAREGDISRLPASVVLRPEEAIGRAPRINLAAGQPLRQDMLKVIPVVRQGQQVRLIYRGNGFVATQEGKALNNAAAGELVRVRTLNGRTVSGTANAQGIVEMN